MDLLLKVSFILLIDRNILIVELDIPLAHPVLTRSAYPTELLTPCLDLLQFREVPSALVFFTSSTQSALHLISKDVGPSFLLWTLLVEIVPHLKVLHEHLLSLVTPIHITDALLTIVKVPHVPGPVLAQHLLPTSALEANGESFLNLLSPLLSLKSVLLF